MSPPRCNTVRYEQCLPGFHPGSQLPKPLALPERGDKQARLVTRCRLWSSVPELNRSHEGEMGVTLLRISPLDHNWVMLMTCGKHLRMGARCQGNQPHREGRNFFPGKGRGWRLDQSPMASDLSIHAHGMEPPYNPKKWGSESFQVGESEHLHVPSCQGPRGQTLLCLGPCPVSHFIRVLTRILCNTSII